jgi:threonyl-tRNA synthetase
LNFLTVGANDATENYRKACADVAQQELYPKSPTFGPVIEGVFCVDEDGNVTSDKDKSACLVSFKIVGFRV